MSKITDTSLENNWSNLKSTENDDAFAKLSCFLTGVLKPNTVYIYDPSLLSFE